jgi:hypothetical protein
MSFRRLCIAAALAFAAPVGAHAQIRPANPDRPLPPAVNTLRTPPTYALLCRGTASLNVWVRPERNAILIFDRGTKPAGAGLEPGQCAWMDRAVRADEPDRVVQHIPEGADAEAPYLWPATLRDPAKYWVFQVYNNGHGDLVATGSHERT